MAGESSLLQTLNEQEIAAELRDIVAPHMHVRHFGKGEILWREGDRSGLLVSLRKGRVKVYRRLPTGGTVTMFIFLPGDVFGCLPLLDDSTQAASALALDAVEAEVMPRTTFQQILTAEPDLGDRLVALLSRRLRQACDMIEALSTPGARRRVASALLGLAKESDAPPDALHLQLPVSAHEFAGALGMAPETFSRAVSDLATEGIIRRVNPGRLEILDLAALEEAIRSSS